MKDQAHEAGTLSGCSACRETVYEPGWYQMLRRLSEPVEERALHLVCEPIGIEAPAADPWLRSAPPATTAAVHASGF
jgi:hypothetical protein